MLKYGQSCQLGGDSLPRKAEATGHRRRRLGGGVLPRRGKSAVPWPQDTMNDLLVSGGYGVSVFASLTLTLHQEQLVSQAATGTCCLRDQREGHADQREVAATTF